MVRVGVIGVGHIGEHHARVYSQLQGVELAGVVDIDQKRREKVAREYKTTAYADYEQIFHKVDAVSVVVPTDLHYPVAKDFLERGVHCLVEKPITLTLEEAEDLLGIARRKNLILQIGHIERFNSAILEAQKYIKEPKFIEAYRLGPYDPRMANIGVVLDLMIHDIDIVLYLVRSPVRSIDAIGGSVLSQNEDIANARINFQNGCVANISASRVSLEKFRKIRIFQKDVYISLDYVRQSLKIYRKKGKEVKSMKDMMVLRPQLKKTDPLKEELTHFVQCVERGRKPLVSGEHGRDALGVALEILRKIKENSG
jgi:predicted dehydrogenase